MKQNFSLLNRVDSRAILGTAGQASLRIMVHLLFYPLQGNQPTKHLLHPKLPPLKLYQPSELFSLSLKWLRLFLSTVWFVVWFVCFKIRCPMVVNDGAFSPNEESSLNLNLVDENLT